MTCSDHEMIRDCWSGKLVENEGSQVVELDPIAHHVPTAINFVDSRPA